MGDNFVLCWQNLSAYVTLKENKLIGSNKTHRVKLLNSGKFRFIACTYIMWNPLMDNWKLNYCA